MFLLNDKPLGLDVPFTHDDIQYPANWLRLASQEEREALGITEVADEVPVDGRFYWSAGNPKELEDVPQVNPDGTPLFEKVLDPATLQMINTDKQVVNKGLKSQMISQIKATAGVLLSATDWKVIRAAEGIKPVDADTLAKREAIRVASNANEAAVNACTTVEQLAALQMVWPQEDRAN